VSGIEGQSRKLSLLDRYLYSLMPKPFLGALAVMMTALLLERLLRILNQLAENGGSLALLAPMIGNLVPYYLGLAIPASFFIAIFLVVAKLGDDSEVDALLASGVSITRLSRPFIWVGVGLTFVALLIFGVLQPLGRYGFQATADAAAQGGWDATVQPGAFANPGKGYVLTADRVDITGRSLHGVFLSRTTDNGEQIITAASGRLLPSKNGKQLRLIGRGGVEYRERKDGPARVTRFDNIILDQPFDLSIPPFRKRGEAAPGTGERELTFFELWSRIMSGKAVTGTPGLPRDVLISELGGRLVRCFSLPFLPLLAFPLGMAAKRKGRGAGLVFAALTLLGFHHAVQFGESLGDTGRADPILAVWGPFLLFGTLCVWLFTQSRERPGQNPLTFLFDKIGDLIDYLVELVRKRMPELREE
jgi:lipopolysaccharide export system permease protein